MQTANCKQTRGGLREWNAEQLDLAGMGKIMTVPRDCQRARVRSRVSSQQAYPVRAPLVYRPATYRIIRCLVPGRQYESPCRSPFMAGSCICLPPLSSAWAWSRSTSLSLPFGGGTEYDYHTERRFGAIPGCSSRGTRSNPWCLGWHAHEPPVRRHE